MPQPLLELRSVTVDTGGNRLLDNLSLIIHKQEHWAITGASGSGKTTLARALAGSIFYKGDIILQPASSSLHHRQLAYVEQQHHFKTRSNTNNFYYQQRFNSTDNEDSQTVEEALERYRKDAVQDGDDWPAILHIDGLMKKPLIQLSNGENKRLQLAEALYTRPLLLVLDNPYLGLDTEGRAILHGIIDNIVKKDIHILLITPPDEIPPAITHIAVLENGRITRSGPKNKYTSPVVATLSEGLNHRAVASLKARQDDGFRFAVRMKEVTVRYGDKIILDNINWEVKKGECWSVSGPNGAGKSTLLSLITADNPQAYANDIRLFDRQRGRGETIWDIKRRIGFVSPELHLFFERGATAFQVAASGLFDTIGLFRSLLPEQVQKVEDWLLLLNLDKLRNRPLFQLPAGQQKMILLARALVKNPPLLVLDEPCQGLDASQTHQMKTVIDQLCTTLGTTLIYISHYDSDIPACVNHFLRLENGRVVPTHNQAAKMP